MRPLVSRPMQLLRDVERSIIAQSLALARINRQKTKINSLAEVEFRGFSQWGEDGILDWLVERLPGIPETFIEFGVEDYRESNTRLLLWLRNWRGVVIDGSPSHVQSIRAQDVSWRFDLTALCAFIDRDNIDELILQGQLHGEIGVLSVDIDGNDYWVWERISVVDPLVVICEYNAVFGDLYQITVPYQADFVRGKAHHSNLYFGASLKAMIGLASLKGYTFVGTNLNGCNAFFVRSDRADEVLRCLENVYMHGSRIREARNEAGRLSFLRGKARVDLIRHLPVFDLEQRRECILERMGELNSERWQTLYG